MSGRRTAGAAGPVAYEMVKQSQAATELHEIACGRSTTLPYHLDRHEAGIGCLQRHFGSRIVGPGRTADGRRLLRHGKVGRAHRQFGAAYCYL